ncbi:MAG: UDP-glucose 4-epimerase GalE [Candidatus Moranbacteria bacterium]|nr:UDP-glucose 4-epimerase GalE [Candidatus Moranbacteria bacterium]
MKIFVTGGAGFIGSHTVVELISSGYTPIIIDNLSHSHENVISNIEKIVKQKVIFCKEDCTDKKKMDALFAHYRPQGVIHFSAFKSVSESVDKPLLYWKNNIDSLLTILEMAQKYQTKFFVFSSSATVYGDPEKLPLKETTPRKASTNAYGATKQAGEDIVQTTCLAPLSKIKGISLRYFNPIGAHASNLIGELPLGTPQNLIPFITQTAVGLREKLTVFGNTYPTPDGTCLRDYIHVLDLARAHIFALKYLEKNDSPSYDIYNIGTGKPSSVLEVIQTFEEISGVSLPYSIGPKRQGDIANCYAEVSKAKRNLGWQAEFSLKQALSDAWKWQQSLKY